MNKEEVFTEIEKSYRESYRTLCSSVRGQVGSWANAEDTVQETYTRACQYWKSYDPEIGMYPWISGILANCVKRTRQTERAQGMVNYSEEELGSAGAVGPNAFKQYQTKELLDFIGTLAPNVKRVVSLYVLSGFNSNEIAEMVPENPNHIRKIVQRFREDVRFRYG